MNRFIKFNPDSDVFTSLVAQGYHKEIVLLSVMATRARRSSCKVTGLNPGECFLGDYAALGLSERQYRTAKKNLEKFGLATFKATNKGTVGKLTNSDIYDINESESDRQKTGSRRTGDEQATTNKNDKNVKKEKNTTGGSALDLSNLPNGVSEELALEFIEHRRKIKKPLTQHGLNLCMQAASKASEHGLTPEKVIDETIVAGWMKPNPEWVAKRLGSQAPASNVTPIKRKDGAVRDERGQIKGWWMFDGTEFVENPEYRRPA